MLSSHHATNLQRSGLATLRFLELPCNQQKERDPGYRAVVQPSGNKPAIHTPNSPPCKRTPQIQPTCCNLSLMQRTKSLDHPPAALTQPWKKKKLQLRKPFPRRSSPSSSSSSHRFFFVLLQSKIDMWTLQETTIIRRNPFAKSPSCTTTSLSQTQKPSQLLPLLLILLSHFLLEDDTISEFKCL